jgi:hypothetical protein
VSFLVVVFGCLSPACHPPPESLPSLQADHFRLTIEAADWSRLDAGHRVSVLHRLSNAGQVPVCVGGPQQFLVDGYVLQSTFVHHSLCRTPVIKIPPGGTGEWKVDWIRTGCWEEIPPGIAERLPHLRCGENVEVRSRITLYPIREDVPQSGAMEILSDPVLVATVPDNQ